MKCEFCGTVLDPTKEFRKVPYCSEHCRRKIYLFRKQKQEIKQYIKTGNKKLENFSIHSLRKYGFVVIVREKTMEDLNDL